MSDLPFVDRLGDALERAITPAPPPRRSWGPIAAAAGFAVVIATGAVWWLVGAGSRAPRPDPVATTAPATTSTVAVTTTTRPPAGLPAVWGRVAGLESLAGGGFATLNAVAAGPDGFVAAGTVSADGDLDRAVVVTSPDGAEWSELPGTGLEGGFVNDVAVGPAGDPVAVGGALATAPVARFWVFDGSRWAAAAADTSYPAAAAAVVIPVGDGYVAGGTGYLDPQLESAQHAAVWVSADGESWEERRPESFAAPSVAEVSALAARDGRVVAGGLWSAAEGASEAAVWVSDDLEDWRFVTLPTDTDGFAGVAGLAAGGPGFVAVGFEAQVGTAGAVWTSADGASWQRVPHDPELFGGDGQAHTRIQDVAAVPGGLVAVGSELLGPDSRKVFWTSVDGLAWERIDVAGAPLLDGATLAHDVAESGGTVVAVGAELALGANLAIPAAWAAPPPPGVEPDAPVVAASPPPPLEDDEVAVTAEPVRATPGTRVLVTVDGPPGEDSRVWLVGPSGEAVEACTAAARGGRQRWCRFEPGEVGAGEPGSYEVAVGDPAEPVAVGTLEVVASGTELVHVDGVYTPFLHPVVQQVSVRNDGDRPLDVSGWAVQAPSGTQRLDFPAGLVLQPGEAIVVFQGGPGGGVCSPDQGRFLYTCNHFAGGVGATAHWTGGAVVVDGSGEVRAEWEPPR